MDLFTQEDLWAAAQVDERRERVAGLAHEGHLDIAAGPGCRRDEVYIASTGVIGEPVPPDFIAGKLAGVRRDLGPRGWRPAAEAIMTTDTFAKAASRTARTTVP